ALERVVHENSVLAIRTGGQECHRTADQFLDPPYVFHRLCRQFGPGASASRGVLPSFHRLVNRLDSRLRAPTRRKIVDFAAVGAITDTNLDLVEAVEDVELGQRQPIDAAGADGLAHQYGVEPAAAAPASGHRAEFAATVADQLADGILLFGRERPFAHPRGRRLAH